MPVERPLPVFKYHPDPVGTGAIIPSDATCPACGLQTGYAYDKTPYHEDEIENLCPWCIHDGTAARRFGCTFVDVATSEDVSDAEACRVLEERTPEYTAWQTPEWLAHCGDYCAFLGDATSEALARLGDAVASDLDDIADETDRTVDDLRAEAPISMYLFRCLRCGTHRLRWDCD